MNLKLSRFCFFLAAGVLCAAAQAGTPAKGMMGACLVNYADPVFTIDSVVDVNTDAPIDEVTLTHVTVNGAPLDLGLLPPVAANVKLDGAAIVCKVPCGFATAEGSYTMEVSAKGYQPRLVSTVSKYASFNGGCPATYKEGQSVAVRMQPR